MRGSMAISLTHIGEMLTPGIYSMIGSSPDKSICNARIEIDYAQDRIDLVVTRRHPVATRYDIDNTGPRSAALARVLSRRMLTFLGHDLKNTAPRQLTIARRRMNVRAKEARGLKKKKVSRMKRFR